MHEAPRAWPLLGHLPAFRGDSTGFLQRIAREQGDVARFTLGRRPAFLFSHPDDIRAILIDHALAFRKGDLMQRARRLLGDGLLTSEGERHRVQRRRILPVFSAERLSAYSAQLPDMALERTAGWRSGSRVRVEVEMEALTMSVVARTLLGTDIEADVPALGGALRRLSRWAPLLAAPGGRLLERTRLPVLRRLRDSIELVEHVIDARIAEGGKHSPLISALLRHGTGAHDARQIRDEVMTIFLAGHDTTAAALMWTWLLLGVHEDIGERVHEEARSVGAGSDSAAYPYTNAVVKEVLRLYPPISRIGRRPLQELEIHSQKLDPGCSVFVSPFVTQRDERFFDRPADFIPERWLRGSNAPRFAWFPFGAGPRSCVGEHFAMRAMVLAITTIAQDWRLRPAAAALPRPRSLLTLKPRGPIWMVTERY